ncbi:MAG: heavy metal translocating P-type ATPase [Lachnospiraceae bacterium]|nr:heavy metal translocating P-type ATPase [Lachnospiraceae bacterium]
MKRKQKKLLYRIILAGILFAILMVCEHGPESISAWTENTWLFAALCLVPYLIVGYDVLRKAVLGIIHGQVLDENFLMTVATVGAFALGDFIEAVAVLLFYQIGELFQQLATAKSRKSIADLMDIRPDIANLEAEDGTVTEVDPGEVPVGSIVVVRPGEKVPIDGVVESGTSSLNTAALTGESMPRDVLAGDEIVSGCVNLTGTLRIRTTKDFGESTVSKILELVEHSGSKKSKSERFITRFAQVYTPAVCLAALVLAFLPPVISLLIGKEVLWGQWIGRGLTFLVISCPCALVISIPLGFFGGIGCASRCGILVKGSDYLERLAALTTLVMDKTGTLTRGQFAVHEVQAVQGDPQQVLYYAACAEKDSNHPIALCIKNACGVDVSMVETNITERGGFGLHGTLADGTQLAVGNARLMQEQNITGFTEVSSEKAGAQTVVYVAKDGAFFGTILIEDPVKETSAEALKKLRAAGIDRMVMLTGDSEKAAHAVANRLGIDEYYAGLLPEDKVRRVEELIGDQDAPVGFVGDGINDAPVLALSYVGIAMGAMGSDAAIEAADVVLMDDDPMKIALARKISLKTLRIVRENVIFALGVKALCLLLGALGLAGMWLAVFADVGVMVLAVLNSMRALKAPKEDEA